MLLVCMQYSDRIESESESEIKSNQVRTFSDKAAGENKGKHRRLLLEWTLSLDCHCVHLQIVE